MRQLLLNGLHFQDFALFLLRQVLGWFFILARFRWICDPSRASTTGMWFNADRRHHLEWKLCSCGYSRHPALSGFVAMVEILAGGAVVVGLLTVPALLGLLAVLVCATYCTAQEKVKEQNPVDCIDCVSCYLWRVEGVYLALAVALLCLGPGKYALDAWVW